jgi:hypothetical protein
MFRQINAFLLALVVALTSFSLAGARGTQPDAGDGLTMVICSGVEMVTITIGPDGEPIEESHLCPDATALFASAFALDAQPEPARRLLTTLAPNAPRILRGKDTPGAQARDPPLFV